MTPSWSYHTACNFVPQWHEDMGPTRICLASFYPNPLFYCFIQLFGWGRVHIPKKVHLFRHSDPRTSLDTGLLSVAQSRISSARPNDWRQPFMLETKPYHVLCHTQPDTVNVHLSHFPIIKVCLSTLIASSWPAPIPPPQQVHIANRDKGLTHAALFIKHAELYLILMMKATEILDPGEWIRAIQTNWMHYG